IGQSSQVIFSQNQVAKVIEQHRIAKSKYAVRPTFTYEQVRKGLRCQVCRGKQYFLTEKTVVCEKCQRKSLSKACLHAHVKEFHLLFPEKMLSSKRIYDWCGGAFKVRYIRKVLAELKRNVENDIF